MDLRRRRQRRQHAIRSLTAIASLMLAWWLFDLAGYRPFGSSVSQWFSFVFCYIGIDRIVRFTVDLLVIAFEPRENQAPRTL
jgi:hypothetical protein